MNSYYSPYATKSDPPITLTIPWLSRPELAPEDSQLGRKYSVWRQLLADRGAAHDRSVVVQVRQRACHTLIDGADESSDFVAIAAALAELYILEPTREQRDKRVSALSEQLHVHQEAMDALWRSYLRLRSEIEQDAQRGLTPSDRQRAELLSLGGTVIPE